MINTTKGTLKTDLGEGVIKTYEVVINNVKITPRIEDYRIHGYNLDKFDGDLQPNTPEGDYRDTINKGVDIEFDGYVIREV